MIQSLGRLVVGVCAATLLLAAGSVGAQVTFTEVTQAAGLGSYLFGASHGHGMGAAWIDFNDDGWPDLFIVNGKGKQERLFENDQAGGFINRDAYLPALPDYEQMGAVFADYDNDGDSDIYIFTDNEVLDLMNPINPQDGPEDHLLKNLWVENGGVPSTPLFQEVAAAANVADARTPPWGPSYDGWRSATGGWLDYDRDGFTDLFIGHWVMAHQGEPSNRDRLYRNRGDGVFQNKSTQSGIATGDPLTYRAALVAVGAHLDRDLWPDIYVGNAEGAPPLHHDMIWQNNGDGTFTDVTGNSPGVGDDSAAAMGIAVGDVDLDGDWDLYVTDIFDHPGSAPPDGNAFYLGNGDGTFQDNTADIAGIAGTPLDGAAWGANFFDADQDGYEDLFVATVGNTANGFPNLFFRNNGDGTFTDLTATWGPTEDFNARGSAVADYDRDGDLDLIVLNTGPGGVKPQLFRNDSVGGSSLQFDLEGSGSGSNRDAIGAIVKVRTGDTYQMRQVMGGNSAHSQDESRVHFGLGSATQADVVEILWPSGLVEIQENVAAGQVVSVQERPEPTFSFTDVTQSAGIDFTHDFAALGMTPRIAGGIAAADYDGDGWVDLYAVAGDLGTNRLYRNLGDGTFVDMAAAAGVAIAGENGSGPRFFDYDGDGWEDLLVGGASGVSPRLFRNQGNGTFVETTGTSGITSTRSTLANAVADVDRDHDLDLYLAHWGPGDTEPCSEPCTGHLWLNDGDGSFTDSDVAWGIDLTSDGRDFTFAPNFADFDADGWPDLISVNDFGNTQVFMNQGGTGYLDVTDEGVITDENGMGSATADFDRDGNLDAYATSIYGVPHNPNGFEVKTGNRFYRGLGDGTFEDATAETGTRIGYWGWGPCAADFNNDGWTDIFHVNGWDPQLGYESDPSRLYLANGDGTFMEVSEAVGAHDLRDGRGIGCFDYDRDGDVDVLISNNQQAPVLFRNDGGNSGNWVHVSLKSRTDNRRGIGARISVTADAATQVQELGAPAGFVSHGPPEAHFGLGDAAAIDEVVVSWPNGIVNTYDDVALDSFVELRQIYDSLGHYIPSTGKFHLKHVNENGAADLTIAFGPPSVGPNWRPIVGDWNGDEVATIGLYNGDLGKFLLRNSNTSGTADLSFKFGAVVPGVMVPVVGDWDGDGVVTIGTYRGDQGRFALRNANASGPPDLNFVFGPSTGGYLPVAGDWDGDGDDTIGLYNTVTGHFLLKNSNEAGAEDLNYQFGPVAAGVLPVAGDWDGDGVVTVGVYDPATSMFHLRNEHAAGTADILVDFGTLLTEFAVAGMWN